jgi:HSP20 family protein
MKQVTQWLRRLRAEPPQAGPMPAELWETAHTLIVRIELPGIRAEDFKVSIDGNVLRIRGEKLSEHDPARRYHFMERVFGSFERSIPLPATLEAAGTETSCRDGVLTVIVHKAEPVPPSRR